MTRRGLLLAGCGAALPALAAEPRPALAAEPHPALVRGAQTGLLLPRYASLRAAEANLRRGPGLRYPILWVYQRRMLPVEILREYGDWRQLRMPDGTIGWMHRALLSRDRTFIVTHAPAVLRAAPKASGRPVARLQRSTVGRLRHCARGAAWCEVEAAGYHGFLLRSALWGSDADPAG